MYTVFLLAPVQILDILDQQEKFAISVTCATKLTLVAKATFICKILCFEAFKILFGQLIFDRMLENKSLHELKATLNPSTRRVHLWGIFWPYWLKMVPALTG